MSHFLLPSVDHEVRPASMTTLYVKPSQEAREALLLVRSAVESEIAKLELALKRADKRLTAFEQKYGVSSADFMATMSVEDFINDFNEQDGHQTYITWAGEVKLKQRLEAKLYKLQAIDYDDTSLFQPN
jgi:hypothetical protein